MSTDWTKAGQLVFVAYPNPAMDWVAVELENGAMAADIMVFDNTGRVVTQLPFNGTRLVLDVAKWSAGTYHLQSVKCPDHGTSPDLFAIRL